MEVVLEILDFSFNIRRLTWRSDTTAKALPTTSRIKLINKKEFTKAALDTNSKTFVIYIVALEIPTTMLIHFLRTL